MQLLVATTDLVLHLTTQVGQLTPDELPKPADVKAGWTAFAIFLGLIVALAVLGWALTKQLKRTDANRRSGAFGPEDADPAEDTGPDDEQHRT